MISAGLDKKPLEERIACFSAIARSVMISAESEPEMNKERPSFSAIARSVMISAIIVIGSTTGLLSFSAIARSVMISADNRLWVC